MAVRADPYNPFQRLLLQWDRLHPYNAGQMLKLAGTADARRVAAAWDETLAILGVERAPVQAVPEGTPLADFISEQLNTPFDRDGSPFRPFLLEQSGHHYAGVIYHHWVADSASIRMLLREWFLRMHAPERARQRPFREGRYLSLFGPRAGNWSPGGGLLSAARWAARNRQIARIEHAGHRDFTARFSIHELGPNLVDPLLAYSRGHGASLNDLFLAAIAQTCKRFVPVRQNPRRPNIGLGTIVDLRPYSRQNLSDTFGLYLGFTSTICTRGDLGDFPRLLRSIAEQSRRQRAERVPLTSPVRMLAGLAVGRLFSRKRAIEFYRKRVPLAGGISNVNLNRDWPAEFHPSPLLDYVRVSPTGPMMPLAFTPTTLGPNLHLGLTYRPSLIPSYRAREMAEDFALRLRTVAGR